MAISMTVQEVLKGLEDGDNDTDDEVQSNIVKFVC